MCCLHYQGQLILPPLALVFFVVVTASVVHSFLLSRCSPKTTDFAPFSCSLFFTIPDPLVKELCLFIIFNVFLHAGFFILQNSSFSSAFFVSSLSKLFLWARAKLPCPSAQEARHGTLFCQEGLLIILRSVTFCQGIRATSTRLTFWCSKAFRIPFSV